MGAIRTARGIAYDLAPVCYFPCSRMDVCISNKAFYTSYVCKTRRKRGPVLILSLRSKMSGMLTLVAFVMIVGGSLTVLSTPVAAQVAQASSSTHVFLNCVTTRLCTDVAESDEAFGTYVGHDEPSNLFYSNIPGSGNQMQWQLTLPTDPADEVGGSAEF